MIKKETHEKWRNKNKERLKLRNKLYYENNKHVFKEYYEINKASIIKKQGARIIKRRNKDKVFRLRDNIRSLIYRSLKTTNSRKKNKTTIILGCSIEEFKIYIESKFEFWMNWENYAKYNGEINFGWDLDHIIPSSSAKSEEEIIKLNHYSNFQPLCSYNNRYIKSNNT